MKWCAAVLPILLASAAHADIPLPARKAFLAGDFVNAANIAEGEGSAEALAFAARARIADAVTRDRTLCKPCLITAETIAQRAIDRNPNSAEGYIQLAIALGLRGRVIPLLDAKGERLPERGRDAISKALELVPQNPWALAARGAWNLEIVKRAGPILADVAYGASRTEGLKYFREALAADSGNLLLHFHFALSILALDADDFRTEAATALEEGFKDLRTDALTKFTRKRAAELKELLRSGNAQEIEALVRRFQGYRPED